MLTIGTNGTKIFNIIPRNSATLYLVNYYSDRVKANGGVVESLQCVSKALSSVTTSLTSETTGKVYTDTTSLSQNRYYYDMACDFETTLKESSFYILEVKEGSNVIFKDKVFCTDQIIGDFSVNYNTYTEHSSDNEFIII